MFTWLHHLLEPHCADCLRERMVSRSCQSCAVLQSQLDIANFEKKQLLAQVIELTKPEIVVSQERTINPEEIKPKTIAWNVRRQMLEAEDRKKAQLLRDAAKREEENKKAADLKRGPSGGLEVTIGSESRKQSIEELEQELGITEEVN